MRIPRIYSEQDLLPGREVLLPEQAGEHVARVLRMERGHPLILFNGDGRECDARLASLAKRAVTAEVLSIREVDREAPLKLTLAQSIARGEKMDWILQKATELGVARIVPIVTERTEVKLDEERAERRLAHWRNVAIAACEQSGRARVPDIAAPAQLTMHLSGVDEDVLRLALDPEGEPPSTLLHAGSVAPTATIHLVVGPEGGLSERDLAQLRAAGFRGLRLGPRILRTETAGPAALAALQALLGDLR